MVSAEGKTEVKKNVTGENRWKEPCEITEEQTRKTSAQVQAWKSVGAWNSAKCIGQVRVGELRLGKVLEPRTWKGEFQL